LALTEMRAGTMCIDLLDHFQEQSVRRRPGQSEHPAERSSTIGGHSIDAL